MRLIGLNNSFEEHLRSGTTLPTIEGIPGIEEIENGFEIRSGSSNNDSVVFLRFIQRNAENHSFVS